MCVVKKSGEIFFRSPFDHGQKKIKGMKNASFNIFTLCQSSHTSSRGHGVFLFSPLRHVPVTYGEASHDCVRR